MILDFRSKIEYRFGLSCMKENELKDRTKTFALRVIKLVNSWPKTTVGYEFGKQIFLSGTSVVANYRAACRAKSRKDFVYKLEYSVRRSR